MTEALPVIKDGAKMTLEEWRAQGKELYGEDQEQWSFCCPACKMDLSLARAKQLYPELAGCGWRPGQECIGRYTDKVKCDWAAYGLFRGPVILKHGDKELACFEFSATKGDSND